MSERIPSTSTEYIGAVVRLHADGKIIDPTGYAVSLAFTTSEKIEPTTWIAGSWEQDGVNYKARVLVGPHGDVNPGEGVWALWVRLEDDPETPVRFSGYLVIT